MGAVLKKSLGHERQADSACKYFFRKVQCIAGTLNRSLAEVLWIHFDDKMAFVKWGSAMLCVRPTRDLKSKPSLLMVPSCECKSMPGCWFVAPCGVRGWRELSGLTLPHGMRLRHMPARGEKHIKDPFYSINISWSNVSHGCTFFFLLPLNAKFS